MEDLIKQIRKLFVSRDDTFSLQTPDGQYVRVRRELTDEDIRKHLAGEHVVGVYELDRNSNVKWICWDFDAHDGDGTKAKEDALKLFSQLRKNEVYKKACLLEHSGGGYHVWLFFSEPLPAAGAKWLAEELAREAEVEAEIFPKQESLPPDGVGSLVKLPMGRNLKWGNWSVLLDPTNLLEIEPVSIPAPTPRKESPPSTLNLSGCLALGKISQGVDEGCRDEAAFFLARYMYAMGLPSYMAYSALLAWDRKNRPPLGEKVIADKVKSAYRKGYRVGSLSLFKHELLGKFCEGCRRRVCLESKKKKKSANNLPEVLIR